MRAPLVAAIAAACCLVACHRERARAPAVLPPPTEIPTLPFFRPIARGIAVAELERRYDDHVAEIDLVRLDLGAVSFELRPLADHRFSPLFDDASIDVAINGGYFEADFGPSGLVVARGETLAPLSPRGGSGVLVVRDGLARIDARDALGEDAHAASLAVQCGPRLVETGGVVGIGRDDGKRAARTAVCAHRDGRTLDVVVARRVDGPGGPGLLHLAQWLSDGLVPEEPGCHAALNLDGGPSTALYVRGHPSSRRVPPGPVVHAILIRSGEPRP